MTVIFLSLPLELREMVYGYFLVSRGRFEQSPRNIFPQFRLFSLPPTCSFKPATFELI